jgi:very-long-chain enoyl-CoA reductase
LIAAPLYGPWNGAQALAGTVRSSDNWINRWVGLWLVSPIGTRGAKDDFDLTLAAPQYGELSNLLTHLNLRSLRPAGTRTRAIPRGYGFNLVSCPNYFFEAIAWIAFVGLTLDPACKFLIA